jgi:hypothetical protein
MAETSFDFKLQELKRLRNKSPDEAWRYVHPGHLEEIRRSSEVLQINMHELWRRVSDGKVTYKDFVRLSPIIKRAKLDEKTMQPKLTEEQFVAYQKLYHLLKQLPDQLAPVPVKVQGWKVAATRELIDGKWSWCTEPLRDLEGKIVTSRVLFENDGTITGVEGGELLSEGSVRKGLPFQIKIAGETYRVSFKKGSLIALKMAPAEPVNTLLDLNNNGKLEDTAALTYDAYYLRFPAEIPYSPESHTIQLAELQRAVERDLGKDVLEQRTQELISLGRGTENLFTAMRLHQLNSEGKGDSKEAKHLLEERKSLGAESSSLHAAGFRQLQYLSFGRVGSFFYDPASIVARPESDSSQMGMIITLADDIYQNVLNKKPPLFLRDALIQFHADPLLASDGGREIRSLDGVMGLALRSHTRIDGAAIAPNKNLGRVQLSFLLHNDSLVRKAENWTAQSSSILSPAIEINFKRNQGNFQQLILSYPESFFRVSTDLISLEAFYELPLTPGFFLSMDLKNTFRKDLRSFVKRTGLEQLDREIRDFIDSFFAASDKKESNEELRKRFNRGLHQLLFSPQKDSLPEIGTKTIRNLLAEQVRSEAPIFGINSEEELNWLFLKRLQGLSQHSLTRLQLRHQKPRGTVVGVGLDFALGESVMLPQPLFRVKDQIVQELNTKNEYRVGYRALVMDEVKGSERVVDDGIFRSFQFKDSELIFPNIYSNRLNAGETLVIHQSDGVSLEEVAPGRFYVRTRDSARVIIEEDVAILPDGSKNIVVKLSERFGEQTTRTSYYEPNLRKEMVVYGDPLTQPGLTHRPEESSGSSKLTLFTPNPGTTRRDFQSSTPLNLAFQKLWRTLRLPQHPHSGGAHTHRH